MAYQAAVPQDIWETVQALKGVFGNSDGTGYNSEQIDFIAKTFGISSGFQPYDLSAAAYYLIPTFSPIRNRLPRLHLQGSNMEFKSVTNPDTGNATGLMPEGGTPTSIATQFADVITQFKAYGVRSDAVTFEQLFAGAGKAGDLNVDSRAIAVANLLKKQFILEERLMLGGVGAQAQIATTTASPNNGFDFTIGGPIGHAPPGGTEASSSTGGTIGADTVDIQYCAVSSWGIAAGMGTVQGSIGYGTTQQGQSLPQSADLTTAALTGSTNSVTFTPPNKAGTGFAILGWAVYVGIAGQGGAHYYYGFTTGKPLVITSIPTTGQQTPTTDYSYAAVTGGTGSSVEGSFNGILPWLFGTGTNATIVEVNGVPTLANYQNGFVTAFENYFADPDGFWVSAADLNTLTGLLTGNNSGQPYWFAANQGNPQGDMVAGFRVSRFLNPVTSRLLPVDVHAYLPQGTAMALTIDLPPWFVGNNVPSTWIWGGNMDYLEIDYQPTPDFRKFATDIECVGALHCFYPAQNIAFTGLSN